MPNRYERGIDLSCGRTFIDGNLQRGLPERWTDLIHDDDYLSASALGTSWSFHRARNPHSGMFILTREQLRHWMDRPHWMDMDTSFVGPLESAATLGMMKTFAIYKCFGRSLDVFAVEHLDDRYSSVLKHSDKPHQRLR